MPLNMQAFCRKQCDPLRTVKGLSARFSGGPHAGSGKASLCLRDSCTCGRTCLFCFSKGKGGKAIAASFGAILGLFPELFPLAALAFFYIMFSTLVVIKPHLIRSVVTFALFALTVYRRVPIPSIQLGCLLISIITISSTLFTIKRGDQGILRFSQALILQSCVTRAFFSIRSSSRSIQLKMLCSLTCPISFSSSTKLTSSTSLFCRVSFPHKQAVHIHKRRSLPCP